MTELKQKRIWDKRHFTLLNDGVRVRIKNPLHDVEVKVKYEDLGFEVSYVRKKEASWVFTVLLFLGIIPAQYLLKNAKLETPAEIVILSLILVFVASVLILTRLETRKPLTVLEGGEKQIAFLSKSPNKEVVSEFINEIHQRMRDNLIRKYIRPDDPSGDINQKVYYLNGMRDQGIISDEKHAEVLDMINSHKSDKSIIGFNKLTNE